jgi:hypothetical protein
MTDCADCGYAARPCTATTLNRGSSVREPGEALCAGCSSRRTKMVKEVMDLPGTIDQIKALRVSLMGAA